MAVVGTAVEKAGSPGQMTETRDGLSMTREFLVNTDDLRDGPITVLNAPGLPLVGNSYAAATESHPYLFCVRRRPDRVNPKSSQWVVACEYETPTTQLQRPDTPEFELPSIRTDSYPTHEELEEDLDGVRIANGAGDPFRPAYRRTVHWPTLFISRNEPVNSPILATQKAYQGRISSDVFWGDPAGKWLCARIRSNLVTRLLSNGTKYPYLRVDYEFHYADTWQYEPLNKGYYYLNGAGKRLAFKTADGREYEGLLAENGQTTIVPHYMEFRVTPSAAFAGLQLPQSYLDAVA